MKRVRTAGAMLAFVGAFLLAAAQPAGAQLVERGAGAVVPHQVEVRLMHRGIRAPGVRVRIVRQAGLQPVGDTITRQDGDAQFTNLREDDYLIQTYETDKYEATETKVSVLSRDPAKPQPTRQTLLIELPLKKAPAQPAPGVVTADVDLKVPKQALKHYEAGLKALRKSDSARAVKEFRAAIEEYPDYYSARLELGRKLRLDKRPKEAEEVLRRLREIAPKKSVGRIEHAVALLELGRRAEAATELRAALTAEEANWAAHLYLGWALLEEQPVQAIPHLTRALALDEPQAARAHLGLAQIAEQQGDRQRALQHLDAYVALVPEAPDAAAARRLAARLRDEN